MRLGVIANRIVLVDGDTAVDIERTSNGRFPADPERLFDAWDNLVEWAATAEFDGERLPLEQLQNPVPAPRQVFGIGANYIDHVEEAGPFLDGRAEVIVEVANLVFALYLYFAPHKGSVIGTVDGSQDNLADLDRVGANRESRDAQIDFYFSRSHSQSGYLADPDFC